MSVRDDMRRILEAGAVEVSRVADPVQRDRTSAAGQVAARTVRQLSMLLGNLLTADMIEQGFGPLLAFLASPRWLQWTTWSPSPGQRGSQLAREARGDTLPADFDAWAQPVGLEGGDDATLRGVPGGGARAAVRLYLSESRTAVTGSPVYQSWAYRMLNDASTAFARPAIAVINVLEGMADTGAVRNPAQARQAVRAAYWSELNFLGAQNAGPARVEVIGVQVPGPVAIPRVERPRVELGDALRVDAPGPFLLPGVRLDGQAPSTRNEGAYTGDAPLDPNAAPADNAPAEGAPSNTKKKRPAWVVPVVVTTLTTVAGVIINKFRS